MICVLQFDAASVALLERMLAAGKLPCLAGLLARGQRVDLETPARDFAAGAFPTLYSGVELADHGLFYPFQWSPQEQRARYTTAFEAQPAVWERLADSGLRTLAIDPYECRPPARASGVFVCGWGFSDRVVLPRWSVPRAAGPAFARRFGRGPGATEIFGRPRSDELLRLRDRLLAAPERISRLARHVLARERFDLAWLTFSAAHLGGHAFWDISQLGPGSIDAATEAVLAGALEEIYEAVDLAMADVVATLGDADDVIVTSAVGMDVNTSRADLLPEMLAAVLAGGPLPTEEAAGGIWRLRAAIPAGARRRVADAMPARLALELTSRLELRGIDWSRTRAFAHPADNQGYVRFNLKGRERNGIVEPAAAGELGAEVAAGLATFRDPDGHPAVAAVDQVAEHYSGLRADALPDLIVRWSERPATRLEQVSSERFGVVRRRGGGSGRSGNHTPGDAWAVLAPGSGSTLASGRDRPRLVDVAATICELSGARSEGLAGEPLLVRA